MRNPAASHNPIWNVRAQLLLVGLASGALLLLTYTAQHAFWVVDQHRQLAGNVLTGQPGDRRRLLQAAVAYYSAIIGLFALFGWLLRLCHHGLLVDRLTRRLALLFPVLFNLGFLMGRPYLSIDAFTYIAHGYLATLPDGNPYLQAARNAGRTPLGPPLIAAGWRPVHGVSPYGPLWTQLEIALVRLTHDLPTALLLFKLLVVIASLVSALLIWLILGRLRPRDQLFGTLLYLWNPLIIIEFAAEGHNDAVMIALVLLGLFWCVRPRPTAALIATALAALAKFLPLIFLPPQLVYLWRTRSNARSFVLSVATATGTAILLTLMLYRHLWIGTETFNGLLRQSRRGFYASNSGMVWWSLAHSQNADTAALLTGPLLSGLFAAYVLLASWRIRDMPALLRACGAIALLYILVAAPNYWSWYATLPVALMALTPDRTFCWTILLLSFGSRLVAPLNFGDIQGFSLGDSRIWGTTLIGCTVPLAVFLLLELWPRRNIRVPA
ncbi:MAG: DUF2029 domain-containing protein [Herpetosiphon sp.]